MCSPKTLDLETDVGSIAALEFSGAADGPLIVAIQGKSANIDVITEWEPAGMLLGAAGYRVVLPNLHSNERTKPGTVASADVHAVVRAIYHRYNAASAIIMGKSWGGGEVSALCCRRVNQPMTRHAQLSGPHRQHPGAAHAATNTTASAKAERRIHADRTSYRTTGGYKVLQAGVRGEVEGVICFGWRVSALHPSRVV